MLQITKIHNVNNNLHSNVFKNKTVYLIPFQKEAIYFGTIIIGTLKISGR